MSANTLGETMAALQRLGKAISTDDIDAYRAALENAHKVGVTTEQIEDAYEYTAKTTRRPSLPSVSFDVKGQPIHRTPEEMAIRAGKAPIIVSRSIRADEFWSNIMGSAWESYEWWLELEYLDGAEWDRVGRVRITVLDPSSDTDEAITKVIGLPDLIEAWDKALRTCSTLGNSQPLNIEDLDAADGDCVLQIAVLGEVIYG